MASTPGEVRGNAARLFGYDIFVSFALGPPPRGSRSYASDLARRLRERDFTVFFSEEEAPVGDQLDSTLKRALHRSRILVVVANRGTLADPRWVRAEVDEFRRKHPKRPVIPISVGGALQDATLGPAAEPWLRFSDKIWIDESQAACDEGIVTDGVLQRIVTAPNAMRSRARWRWTVRAAFAVLSIVTASALWFAWSDRRNAAAARVAERNARSGRLAAESQLARASDTRLALLLAREAWQTDPGMEARRALFTALNEPVPMWLFRAQVVSYSQTNPHHSLVWSGDGRFIATAGKEGLIHLWDANTRREFPPIRARSTVSRIAFSPDGRVLASAGEDGHVQLWDPRTRTPVGAPMVHPELVANRGELAWSPDGRVLACAGLAPDDTWRMVLWEVKTRAPIGEPLRVETEKLSRLAFNGDGTLIAACVFDQVHVWNVATRTLAVPPIPTGNTDHVSFLPAESADGSERIAYTGEGIRLWDLEDNAAESNAFSGHSGVVHAFSRAQAADISATGSEDTTIRFWRGNSPDPLGKPLWAQQGGIYELALSPDGRQLAANGSDGLVQWMLNTRLHRFRRAEASTGRATENIATVSDDARWLVVERSEETGDRTHVEWHDLQAGRKTASGLLEQRRRMLAVAHNGTVALHRSDELVELRGAGGQRCTTSETAFEAAFSPDDQLLVTMSREGEPAVHLWRTSDCQKVATFLRGKTDPTPVAFTADGAALLVSTREGIRRWDIAERRFSGAVDIPCALTIAVDRRDRFVAGVSGCAADQGVVVLARIDAQVPPVALRRPEGSYDLTHVAFSPDGFWLAAASEDGMIVLWDLSTNQPAEPRIDAGQKLESVAFSSDSRTLVTVGSDGSHVVWEMDAKRWAAQACRLVQRNLTCMEWQRVMGGEPYRRTCPGFPLPDDAALCGASARTD